jgi:hypothetical protein
MIGDRCGTVPAALSHKASSYSGEEPVEKKPRSGLFRDHTRRYSALPKAVTTR